MNRIRSNKLLDVRAGPGRHGFITVDKLGVVSQKGEPLRPKLLVTFPI